MICYKYPEEKTILLHYAKKLHEHEIINIINCGDVKNTREARMLSKFFWQLVDESVNDAQQGIDAAGHHNLQAYSEYIMNTLRAYLIGAGYEKEWYGDDA